MRIIKKIKAFFSRDNTLVELDLIAAEIKEGRAFLHTREEPEKTYLIRSNDIRISFNEGKSLSDAEILSTVRQKKNDVPNEVNQKNGWKETKRDRMVVDQDSADGSNNKPSQFSVPGFEKYKKRVFSVSLYPEEYDRLIDNMKEYGYKRADFLLACVQCAKKPSMEKAHRAIIKEHKQKLREQKELIAQQFAELEGEMPAV